jgi:hypothetical protein
MMVKGWAEQIAALRTSSTAQHEFAKRVLWIIARQPTAVIPGPAKGRGTH